MTIANLLVVVAASVGLLAVVAAVQFGRLGSRWLVPMAVVCGLCLLAMLLTDWPLGVLSKFWSDHSVLSAVLSTVLLLGIGVLAFEAHDARTQADLDGSITAAGMGGLVERIVEIEVALAMASRPERPEVRIWGENTKKVRRSLDWISARRHVLTISAPDGRPNEYDPRGFARAQIRDLDGDTDWRVDLLDQCIRRIISGLRDWTPAIGRSRTGQHALVDLGEWRVEMIEAKYDLGCGDLARAVERIHRMQLLCRIMTLALERGGKSQPLRDEVLWTAVPFEPDEIRNEKRAGRWGRWMRDTWDDQWNEACDDLIRPRPRSS